MSAEIDPYPVMLIRPPPAYTYGSLMPEVYGITPTSITPEPRTSPLPVILMFTDPPLEQRSPLASILLPASSWRLFVVMRIRPPALQLLPQ